MSEKPPTHESPSETPPSNAEIEALFLQVSEGVRYQEDRMYEDTGGSVYLWEIKFPPDEQGLQRHIMYVREGIFPKSKALETVIQELYYDSDDFPVGSGRVVARFQNGKFVRCD